MIDGLATATMVASTRIMKKPTSIAHKAFQGFEPSTSLRTPPRVRPSCRVVSVWDISGRPGWKQFSRRYVPGYAPTSPGSADNEHQAGSATASPVTSSLLSAAGTPTANSASNAITMPAVIVKANATSLLPSTPTNGATAAPSPNCAAPSSAAAV